MEWWMVFWTAGNTIVTSVVGLGALAMGWLTWRRAERPPIGCVLLTGRCPLDEHPPAPHIITQESA